MLKNRARPMRFTAKKRVPGSVLPIVNVIGNYTAESVYRFIGLSVYRFIGLSEFPRGSIVYGERSRHRWLLRKVGYKSVRDVPNTYIRYSLFAQVIAV